MLCLLSNKQDLKLCIKVYAPFGLHPISGVQPSFVKLLDVTLNTDLYPFRDLDWEN